MRWEFRRESFVGLARRELYARPMKRVLVLLIAACLGACKSTPDYGAALAPGAAALLPLKKGESIPDFRAEWSAQDEILPALDRSITWTKRKHAEQFFPIAGIDHDRALRSLERFRELLLETQDPEEFQRALESEFAVYKSAGWNGTGGGVLFTAYCTPLLPGAKEQRGPYQYPLYGLPDDLVKEASGEIRGWQTEVGLFKYPMRKSIDEGQILVGRDLELVWLRDPLDAFIAHVNGSAFVETESGEVLRFGYAGKNGRRYVSLGRELIEDGILPSEGLSLQSIRDWAVQEYPGTIKEYLNRNLSYVFFQPIESNPHGSLDFEVQANRSLATDKKLFPRGSLVFVDTEFPMAEGPNPPHEPFRQFLFDQDTGGAIRTAGRADIYLGIGPEAEQTSGRVKSEGQLYYLFLKEDQ